MADRTVSLLFFAWLRERVGHSTESIELPEGIATVGALIDWLRARGANYESAFSVGRVVRCAVNQDFAAPDAAVKPGDEVAFFPPVTGG
jgi:molybdopterin converting factor subunit 1